MFWIARGVLVLTALAAGVSALAQEQQPVTLLPYSSEAYGIETVVPEGWTDAGRGIFARQQDASDPVVLAQQSALASTAEVLASLVPQLESQ